MFLKARPALALVTAALLTGPWTHAQTAAVPEPVPVLEPTPDPVPAIETIPRAVAVPKPRPVPSGPIEVNGIAAKVNGRVITRNKVLMLLAPRHALLSAQYPRRGPQFEAEFNEAKKNIVQELVDREIILDEFKKIGASIRPHVVDEDIKRQIRELYNGNEEKFREVLKKNRMTMEGYREMTREGLVVQAMRAQQFSDAPPPLPNEIQQEYNEMKLSLRDVSKDVITFQKIFIPASDPQDPAATPESQLSHAEELARQLSAGKDFAELAKEYSKDGFEENGGLQEKVPRTDLAPEFAAIIVDAPAGKIIGPLLDPLGFNIVKVVRIDYGPSPSLNDERVRSLVEERVRKKKTSIQYNRWIENRRKRAMIDIRI